jgi:hypothetical protein
MNDKKAPAGRPASRGGPRVIGREVLAVLASRLEVGWGVTFDADAKSVEVVRETLALPPFKVPKDVRTMFTDRLEKALGVTLDLDARDYAALLATLFPEDFLGV